MAASATLFAIGPASTSAVSTDPSSGSPPGTIYKLPVDTGRQDAAPRGDGDGASSGGSVPGSTFRSENNFGTSAVVPGAAGAAAAGANGPSGDGTGGQGGNGGGEEAALSGATETGDTSTVVAYLLLAMILAVGGFLGWLASRAGRRAAR